MRATSKRYPYVPNGADANGADQSLLDAFPQNDFSPDATSAFASMSYGGAGSATQYTGPGYQGPGPAGVVQHQGYSTLTVGTDGHGLCFNNIFNIWGEVPATMEQSSSTAAI